MVHTRRTVLKAAALAGSALLLPSGLLDAFQKTSVPLGADDRPIGRSRFRMTRSVLSGHVGSDFTAHTPGGRPVGLRLVEVEDVPNAAAARLEGAEDTFAARFEDSSGNLLSQGTYTLEHDQLGRLWFFLVPVGQPAPGAQVYEAIFNNAFTRGGFLRRRQHRKLN
jgi:hypothetical protein